METPDLNKQSDIGKTLGIDGDSSSKRRVKRWTTGVVCILILASAALFLSLRTDGNAPQYKTQPVTRGDLTVTVTATGNLAPTSEVQVGSELSGIIKSVLVDYNDKVKIGQPLAYLDATRFEAAVKGSQAALALAQAKLLQSRATLVQDQQNLERMRHAGALSSGRAFSPYDLETAEANVARAKADVAGSEASVQQAQANLKVDETNLSKTVIRSPVNGIVLQRNVDPGQTVAASLQAPVLFTLAQDLTHMELQVDVDEADVGKVAADQPATFTVDAYPNRTFKATITQVRYGSQVTDGVVTYTTLLKVDNPDLALRPGMTATADIVVQKIQNALLIPNAGLRFMPPQTGKSGRSRGLVGMLLPHRPHRSEDDYAGRAGRSQRVWILKGESLAPFRITTGATDGIHTVVTDGKLEPGMKVAVDTISRS